MLSGAELRAVLDSIAYEKSLLDTAVGATGTAATILYAQQANVDRIAGYDESVIQALHKPFVETKNLMDAFKLSIPTKRIRAVDAHLREEAGQGIDDYWTAEQYGSYRIDSRAAELCRACGIQLSAANCFPPVTVMGSEAVTGSGAGTFTPGTDIDANLYGPADCELIVTAVGGASVSLVAAIIGTDENGAEVTGTATFSSAALGDKVDVTPDQTGKQFQTITNITFTGGASGDAFNIQSKVDRAVTA
jgi:hypothetical protein